MSDKLKECPFCGGNAKISDSLIHCGKQMYQPLCLDCDAELGYFDTLGEAVAAWNTRVAVPHEMTAREYIREYRRMCNFYFGKPATDGGLDGCGDCPGRLNGKKNCIFSPTRDESSIPIVEAWAREHPEERSEE